VGFPRGRRAGDPVVPCVALWCQRQAFGRERIVLGRARAPSRFRHARRLTGVERWPGRRTEAQAQSDHGPGTHRRALSEGKQADGRRAFSRQYTRGVPSGRHTWCTMFTAGRGRGLVARAGPDGQPHPKHLGHWAGPAPGSLTVAPTELKPGYWLVRGGKRERSPWTNAQSGPAHRDRPRSPVEARASPRTFRYRYALKQSRSARLAPRPADRLRAVAERLGYTPPFGRPGMTPPAARHDDQVC